MSTKATLRHQDAEGELPAWQVYEELFERDDVVYLELDGVQVNVTMIDGPFEKAGTVRLRLPSATARQLGIMPVDWKHDDRWSRSDIERGIERFRQRLQRKTEDEGAEEP
ncbi:hypothetical protein AB4Y42_14135 [Paraburkholderia sp. EG286B]|uniref:hypothetical protein n=1 Tax=Paraburkholderia sp. EG286B TaxID=3237011 RepID=UPI0034D27467